MDKQEAVCSARAVCFLWEKLTLLVATDSSGEAGWELQLNLLQKPLSFLRIFTKPSYLRVPTRPALPGRDSFSIQILPSQACLVWDL